MAETKDNWNRQLGKIEITGDNKDDKVNFYTALYHTMIAPTIYSDVDGSYYGPDKKIHQTGKEPVPVFIRSVKKFPWKSSRAKTDSICVSSFFMSDISYSPTVCPNALAAPEKNGMKKG